MSERIQLKAGDAAPAFSAPGLDGEPVTLESFAGRGLVLYFYPKDNTAGCTLEAQGFRDHLADFEALGYAVAGVSRDSVKSHCGFRTARISTSRFSPTRRKSSARPTAS